MSTYAPKIKGDCTGQDFGGLYELGKNDTSLILKGAVPESPTTEISAPPTAPPTAPPATAVVEASNIVYKTKTNLSNFCGDGSNGTGKTEMEWKGKDCGDGNIKWDSMKSISGRRGDLTATDCSWKRDGNDSEWQNKYMGSCGVAPTYMSNLPKTTAALPVIHYSRTNIGDFCGDNSTGTGKTLMEWKGEDCGNC